MVKPWVENGHQACIVDIQHEESFSGDNPIKMGQDVVDLSDVINYFFEHKFKPDIVFAFPPCTDLAVSGARWFKDKGMRGLINALEIVEACRVICEASGSPYMIENPVSTLSTYWRKPDYMFDPCDYGDPYTKKTCLWTGNGFVMPKKNRVEPTEGSKFHLLPPSEDRSDIRSVTPMGFAWAVYHANIGEV